MKLYSFIVTFIWKTGNNVCFKIKSSKNLYKWYTKSNIIKQHYYSITMYKNEEKIYFNFSNVVCMTVETYVRMYSLQLNGLLEPSDNSSFFIKNIKKKIFISGSNQWTLITIFIALSVTLKLSYSVFECKTSYFIPFLP